MSSLLDTVLGSTLDAVPDPNVLLQTRGQRNREEIVDPFDHYEVTVNRSTTIFMGERYEDAFTVFEECGKRAPSIPAKVGKLAPLPKAIVHVKGSVRTIVLTNAPYMYMMEKPIKREEIRFDSEA